MKIIIAIILFSIIILFHETGHFLAARACRVRVIEFSLGMGPRLLTHVSGRSGTRYSIKILPFGGSCQMQGEDDEDTQEGSFGTKKVWQRILIVAAGPLFNFLLAFIFAVVIIGSVGYDPPVIEYLSPEYPLEMAGVKVGDVLTSIDGEKITVYRDISNYLSFHQRELARQKPVTFTWRSGETEKSAQIVPQLNESGTRYIFGLYGGSRYRAGSIGTVVKYSLYEVQFWIRTTIGSLRMIGQGEVTLDDVSGPVGVVEVVSNTVEETKSEGAFIVFLNLLNLGILLSANLGVMNLIPFPALDGGRIFLLLLEAVRRKKLGENIEGYINFAGFVILMGLMAVIMFNDIRKLF